MTAVPLRHADDASRFGGKAAQLGAALRAELPAPDGWAIAADDLEALLAGRWELDPHSLLSRGPVAVRSSAIGEDGAQASYAGMFVSKLNVRDADGLVAAVREVALSATSEGVRAYRARMGFEGAAQMALVVQKMVRPDVSGVLFTRHPIDGRDVRVVEASWGLGEAVVSGLVTPDAFVLERGGRLVEHTAGYEEVALRPGDEGGVVEHPVAPEHVEAPCVGDAELAALDALASRCEAVWPGAHDIEFAFEEARLFLLQRRPVTTGGGR